MSRTQDRGADTGTRERPMSDVRAAINEFGKLVGSKNEASSNVFYRWQELRELLDAALLAAGVSDSPDETRFQTLRVWTLQHLNALDDDVLDADGEGVLNSLRMIVTGEHGCTERGDYTDDQWAVLQAAAGVSDSPDETRFGSVASAARRLADGEENLWAALPSIQAGDVMTLVRASLAGVGEARPASDDPREGANCSLQSLLLALEDDERHGNLSGRAEDAWYDYRAKERGSATSDGGSAAPVGEARPAEPHEDGSDPLMHPDDDKTQL